MPVVKKDLEHCLGMVHIKDLFKKINNKSFNINSLLREVIYIPSATPVFNLLQKMKKQNIHLAIVMDEFNSVTGLVTIEDLVEEIVGEIEDEHDKDEAPMYRQKNNNIIMDAAMLVHIKDGKTYEEWEEMMLSFYDKTDCGVTQKKSGHFIVW